MVKSTNHTNHTNGAATRQRSRWDMPARRRRAFVSFAPSWLTLRLARTVRARSINRTRPSPREGRGWDAARRPSGHHDHDHAAVLGPALAGAVRGDRGVLAIGDGGHP